MGKKKLTVGLLIIVSAIIWGAVIIGVSSALRDTGCYDKIQNILVIGVITHLILVWGPLVLLLKDKKDGKSEESTKE